MNYPRETLLHALFRAIQTTKKQETELGYDRPSAFLAGMEEVKGALERGEQIHLTD